MTDEHFSLHVHSACDKTMFTITMRRLIEVHEIHIDRIPRDVTIELCPKMEQWFL